MYPCHDEMPPMKCTLMFSSTSERGNIRLATSFPIGWGKEMQWPFSIIGDPPETLCAILISLPYKRTTAIAARSTWESGGKSDRQPRSSNQRGGSGDACYLVRF